MRSFFAASAIFLVSSAFGAVVTLRNDVPRRAVDGSYVDAHDGLILEHNGTYFLYGESYGNQTTSTPYPWPNHPRLSVYTSTDLTNWTYRGGVLPDTVPGTLWIPNVIWHEPTSRFILWYGSGDWGTATSEDGIHFTPAREHTSSRFANASTKPPGTTTTESTDGTGLFVDDDGVGYVVFASQALPSMPGGVGQGHVVSIERLAPDLLSSAHVGVGSFFPDDYVESPSLFKRKGRYYVTYGSCCCGCRDGGGIVVFSAPSVSGPWTRQAPHSDVNCNNANATICGGFGRRAGQASELVFDAQWWGPSFIPLASGDTAIVFVGRRWLSGENNPAGCHDICGNRGNPKACLSSQYELRSDLSVWYPLEFDDENGGAILPMRPLPMFTLDLP